MFNQASKQITARIQSLQQHLADENPLLVDVIRSFQALDKVAYRVGLLERDDSLTSRIAWWPLISILGTFSAGKSTFINHYLGMRLQQTGNQAVDDKFTVLCYSKDEDVRVLPGLALDADPRLPFYQISEQIEKVASGEGGRVDTYLHMKTCPSKELRGKILIDSPGFDADQQRNSTLRITDHIIDLSDLVLVFFDARHPEPGAMHDTLEHLVAGTVRRNDANKVLFVLNQIDTTAKEDNAEDVVAAWQRALAQCGLVSGRFYTIYSEEAAVPIDEPNLRQRYQSKRDADLNAIRARIDQVGVERVYRIIGSLENAANQIEHKAVPALKDALARWRRNVWVFDASLIIPALAILLGLSIYAGYWQGFSFNPPWLDSLGSRMIGLVVLAALLVLGALGVHVWVRKLTARRIAKHLSRRDVLGDLSQAFLKNTLWWKSLFRRTPTGWTRFAKHRVVMAREAADHFVQVLNDKYANPSGEIEPTTEAPPSEPGTLTPKEEPVVREHLATVSSEPPRTGVVS